jgi:hypothetical protein
VTQAATSCSSVSVFSISRLSATADSWALECTYELFHLSLYLFVMLGVVALQVTHKLALRSARPSISGDLN